MRLAHNLLLLTLFIVCPIALCHAETVIVPPPIDTDQTVIEIAPDATPTPAKRPVSDSDDFTTMPLEESALNERMRFIDYFKEEDGSTNWQYVANFSSGVLILTLSIVVITLLLVWRKASSANKELTAIRSQLETRVRERTAELQESQQYISDILLYLPLMLVGLDHKGYITHWNRKAEELAGIGTRNAMGKKLWEVYPTISLTNEQLNEAKEKNSPVYIKQSQHGLYYFNITIYPLQHQINPGMVILIEDITQKILAENMLIQGDKLASMGELAATMAHDINPPLQDILLDLNTFENIMSANNLDFADFATNDHFKRIKELLADASEKGQHVTAVINNLLTFAKLRNEEKSLVRVSQLMDRTIELAGDVLIASNNVRFSDIKLETYYETGLPSIPCFSIELQQALLSLFRHAFDKLIQKQQPKPYIKVFLTEGHDAVMVKIQHNGLMLTDQEQKTLFEPLVINEPDEKSAERLSFAYYIIVDQHQGYLATTTDTEQECTFFHVQLNRIQQSTFKSLAS